MEELLCPMCGTPNHGEAEECTNCGARLKPLQVSGSSKDSEDWLERIREEAEQAPTSTGTEGADLGALSAAGTDEDSLPEAESAGEGVPEWLRRIREKQAEEPADRPASDEPAPEDALRAAVSRRSGDLAAPDEVEAPENDLRAAFNAQLQSEDPVDLDPQEESLTEQEPQSEPESASEGEHPDWLEAVEGEEADTAGALPHVPALIGGVSESADDELGDLGLPDWLGEIEPLEDEHDSLSQEGLSDLAPATLPNWLEAMRPVDTFRSVVEIQPEDDQAVESVGPLAGLSGVLFAEPVVAMPRTSSVGSMQLDVSERQYSQAELLHRLVDEEEQEAPVKPRRGTRLAVFRWAIAAVILAAVSLPVITGSPSFALPGLEPRELGALFKLVEGLPDEQPVLVVFDYEPGYAGELEAVSGAFLDHIMARGLLVASLSTRPTGSALALQAVEPFVDSHGYKNGQNIVHLGYLSGGQTAVQLFAVNPREAVLKGFALPEEITQVGSTAWDSSVLDEVELLSDFGMVAVITGDSESARVWAEQARPNMGTAPLVVVLSAGAEPLIRPYFESDDPKVGGMLSGLPAAVAYELRNGRAGLAQERWNAFGTAMLAAELVLLAGVGYGVLIWWRARGAG